MTTISEYHVASFIAQIDMSKRDEIEKSIISTPGAEIHIFDEIGKIVFTIESDKQHIIGNYADTLRVLPGVLTLAPVYHQYLEE